VICHVMLTLNHAPVDGPCFRKPESCHLVSHGNIMCDHYQPESLDLVFMVAKLDLFVQVRRERCLTKHP
jgi:hypothetical protein